MLGGSRRNSRRGGKKQEVFVVSEGYFNGLQFVNFIEEIEKYDKVLTANPTITIVDNVVIVDYSNVSDTDNINELRTLFESTLTKGDTITLSDGQYQNALTGDSSIFDISGTYTFESWDKNDLIAFLTKQSIDNESTTYNRYESRYFLNNGTVKWTTSSTVKESISTNKILNILGVFSKKSFYTNFNQNTPRPGDTLEILFEGQTESSTFTITEYRVSEDNIEEITVLEELPNHGTSKITEEIFLRLSRYEEREKSLGEKNFRGGGNFKLCKVAIESCDIDLYTCEDECNFFDDETGRQFGIEENPTGFGDSEDGCLRIVAIGQDIPCEDGGSRNQYTIRNDDTRETWVVKTNCCGGEKPKTTTISPADVQAPSGRRSANVETVSIGANRVTNTTMSNSSGQTKLESAYRNWLNSGRTLKAKVRPRGRNRTGNVYVIDGVKNSTIHMDAGETIRIDVRDVSFTREGYTKSEHPLRISTSSDGIHKSGGIDSEEFYVNKDTGNNRYVYITAPSSVYEGEERTIYYYCKNHPNMGGSIVVKGKLKERDATASTTTPAPVRITTPRPTTPRPTTPRPTTPAPVRTTTAPRTTRPPMMGGGGGYSSGY